MAVLWVKAYLVAEIYDRMCYTCERHFTFRERACMENYADAAESRLKDWEQLNNAHRKVATIHIGGIYIECLLKGMICLAGDVTPGPRSDQWNVDGNVVTRPGHYLTDAPYRVLLEDLYDDMPEEVEHALAYVSSPENKNYIDYRYIQEDFVTDEVYEKWLSNFILIFDYLQDQKEE